MSKKPKNPVSDEQEDKKWGGSADRVPRGGDWFSFPSSLRSAQRNFYGPSYRNNYYGFRIVKNIPKNPKEKSNE